MTDPYVDIYLAKADESLAGAVSEYANGRYNNCANRCYYAVYQAAIYALSKAGLVSAPGGQEWPHEFVRSQFIGQLINRRKVYPASLRNTLEDNRALRQAADYKRENVTEVRASRAIRRTEDFLQAIRERGQIR